MSAPPPAPPALLRQLESAGAPAQPGADRPRGFAFGVEELHLVAPFAPGLRTARWREPQPLPLCHDWVAGMLHIRGEIYTLIDFARFIGRRATPATPGSGLLLISTPRINSALLLARPVSLRAFDPDPPIGEHAGFDAALKPFLSAVWRDDGRDWGVLDVAALTASPRFVTIGR